jgi:hypothetical protein
VFGTSDKASDVTAERTSELFDRICEMHSRRDPVEVRSIFTEDGVYEDDGAREIVRGHAALERLFGVVGRPFPTLVSVPLPSMRSGPRCSTADLDG